MLKNRKILILSALLIVTLLIMWSFYISKDNSHYKISPAPTPIITTATKQPTNGTVGSLPESVSPEFELNDLNGQKLKLSNYKNKLVILNFWKTWETQCQTQLSVLNDINTELSQDENVVILTVNDQSQETIEKFLKQNQYSVTVLNDKEQIVFDLYNVRQIPMTYIIDKDGIIKEISTSVMTKEEVYEIINKYNK